MTDLLQIAYESAKSSVGDRCDEVAMEIPSSWKLGDRTVCVVTQDADDTRENDFHQTPHYYSSIQIVLIGPDRDTVKTLCLEASMAVVRSFAAMVDHDQSDVLGVTRGSKYCGPGAFGNILIDGFTAIRQIFVHNTIEP